MTGKGAITKNPNKKFQSFVLIQVLWIVTTLLLVGWWARLLFIQSEKISLLESQLQTTQVDAVPYWQKMQNMLLWESSAFFLLIFTSSIIVLWLYWRDHKRSKSIAAFFASVTHELRTPLTSIRLQAEAIANVFSKKNENNVLIKRLLEDTHRLELQVEKTLELARVEGGGPLILDDIQLHGSIDRILSTWSYNHSKNIAITNNVDNRLIRADSSALRIILINLLENTLKHSKEENPKVHLSSAHKNNYFCFIYKDSSQDALKTNEDNLGKLFHKSSLSQGAGVGLYLIKTLMQRMNGTALFSYKDGFKAQLNFQLGDLK